MKNTKQKTGSQGFTLIELLIVVALLGALAALVLPSMQANRTKAMEATCDYNQVSTIKTLMDHYSLNGALPDDLHTGNQTDVEGAELMNMPEFTADNIASNCTREALSAFEAASCVAAGLDNAVYGDGTNLVAMSTVLVAKLNDEISGNPFVDDADAHVTFNGHKINWWNSDAKGAGGTAGTVFLTFISPVSDWSTTSGNDWGAGLESTVSVKKVGECKVPIDTDFNYYVAYIKAFSAQNADDEDIPAILVGTSCPECGITNP